MKLFSENKALFGVCALTFSSLLLVSSHTPSEAYGSKIAVKNCASSYKLGKGKHKDKNYAGKNAIKNWNAHVASSLGPKWASWKNASAKSIPCNYSKLWGCRAIAKPCALKSRNKIGSFKQ